MMPQAAGTLSRNDSRLIGMPEAVYLSTASSATATKRRAR
jgi:hypothetical protein